MAVKDNTKRPHPAADGLEKSPTGITGADEIMGGGLPKGRPTLVCGGPGCGKTLFALEFVMLGAIKYGEPGVFMSFEETEEELEKNVLSLGFDLKRLVADKKIGLDFVRVERSEITETGEYDLEGLFIRLGHAIDSIHAKRVVLDTVEALFAGLPNEAILRSELRRLFRWLKDKGVTAVITGEQGERTLTRYGLEEYVADCVIILDHRVINQLSTRRFRIVKYRGSFHGTNEYPFLIGKEGISVLPITALGLDHRAPTQRVSTGVPELDQMFGGKGYYRGSSILVSGTAGSGKSSLAASFVRAASERRERCLYFAFEESPDQIIRNMRSIGIDLASCRDQDTLRFHAVRPTLYGLEMHLVSMHDLVNTFKPAIVVVDPLTDLISSGRQEEVKSMLTRLIDFFKRRGITAFFTSLTSAEAAEQTEVSISSLIDTWVLLRNLEHGGERNRGLYVLKSRGMAHSNQIREFHLSRKGINLSDVYIGPGTVLTGAARLAQEAMETAKAVAQRRQIQRLRRAADRKRQIAEAQIAAVRAGLEAELEELNHAIEQEALQGNALIQERTDMDRQRMTYPPIGNEPRQRTQHDAQNQKHRKQEGFQNRG